MLRSFVGKIEKGFSVFAHRRPPLRHLNEATSEVPDDVREGYFAVVATKDGESRKFIVGLHYLNDPAFLGLLDEAQKEFGFRQKGALAIPCQPQELQNILDVRCHQRRESRYEEASVKGVFETAKLVEHVYKKTGKHAVIVMEEHSVKDFKMLRSIVGKIQKGLSLIVLRKPSSLSYFSENQLETANVMPNDVRKGYFAVLAIKDGETKRFSVELDYLTNPEFLGLLDQAREEYGFKQQGTLEVPCRPQELQKILDGWRMRSDNMKGVGRDIFLPKFL
ncbi:hypothetical protein Fmac_027609 [Flemingia macrophylla]|uniref:Uncharacterized protein n=1 Tax=Flemingia macrophylla TaxID=520843 RepID=A0ABD1LI71_9FABA